MAKQKLLIASEVAAMLGWPDRKKVHEYAKRGTFPAPVMRIGNSPVWTEDQVRKYMNERGIRD